MAQEDMDLMRAIYEVIETGDVSGTHEGEFMGVEPTGNRVEFEVIDIARFENGKGVEHWGVSDAMSLMHQIGAIPGGQP